MLVTIKKTKSESFLAVYDQVWDVNEADMLESLLLGSRAVRRESDQSDGSGPLSRTADYDVNAIRKIEPVDRLLDEIAGSVPGMEGLELTRAYCNFLSYGDCALPHVDQSGEKRAVTVLFFANRRWKIEWGGETLFYDTSSSCLHAGPEASYVVSPKAGRAIVFSGDILHCAGVPTRVCNRDRLSLILKFEECDER